MNIDEDTCEWLGCPTPLEMHKQHALLLENEIQELHLQLRKAREDIYGLVRMHAELSTERDKLLAELKASDSALASCNTDLGFVTSKLNSLEWALARATNGAWGSAPMKILPSDLS